MEKHIKLPLTAELAKTLHAGDTVYLTGTIYTSRDAGHKRMCEALAKGEKLPFDPTDATIYYVGPTPAKPGQVIGSAGPTTSGRMDAYAPTMMSVGARGMIGKGARLPEVVEAMKKYSGVYFGAIGGAGALLPSASRARSSSRMRISAPRRCAGCTWRRCRSSSSSTARATTSTRKAARHISHSTNKLSLQQEAELLRLLFVHINSDRIKGE